MNQYRRKKSEITTVKFTSTDAIDQYEDIVTDFIHQVFGVTGALITDESSLYDFASSIEFPDRELPVQWELITELYDIEPDDVPMPWLLIDIAKAIERGQNERIH